MPAEAFFQMAHDVLHRVEATQLPIIRQVAQAIAERVAHRGILFHYDTGHASQELLGRAGGLFIVQPLDRNITPNLGIPRFRLLDEAEGAMLRQTEAEAEWVLARNGCRPQDALLLGSVSGRQDFVVTLAQRARRKGMLVIAITSHRQSEVATSTHPDGLFLRDVADFVIDNGGVAGDAALAVQGLDERICPTSGLAGVAIGWALVAELVDALLARGMRPAIWRSVNIAGAEEVNAQARQQYEKRGY